jgi:hypothetical protein
MTEITVAVATGLTTAISARDFTPARDERRVEWNTGALRHVVAALAGAPVMIITDAQTGTAMLGAKLISVQHSVRSNYDELVVEYLGQRTAFKVFNIGEVIVPLVDEPGRGVKWEALASYRIERSKAIAKACTEHGVVEGREWGKWDAKLFTSTAQVTYTPSKENPHYADKTGERGYWEYRIADLG